MALPTEMKCTEIARLIDIRAIITYNRLTLPRTQCPTDRIEPDHFGDVGINVDRKQD